MKVFLSILIVTLVSIQAFQTIQNLNIPLNRGFIASESPLEEKIISKIQNSPINDLPTNFSWSNQDGVNYLTLSQNQKLPQYCSSSWAFAATSALSDRIKIARKAQWPDINLSVQVLLSCSHNNFGCMGGDDNLAYEYIYNHEIPDQTCSLYQAKSYFQGLTCTDEIICGDCTKSDGCTPVTDYHKYGISEYGQVSGEQNMMNEIQQRGPISCAMENTWDLEKYTSGILDVENSQEDIDYNHVVSIVGWGEENGTPYWEVRNSWGEYWGERGFFKISRGKNSLGIESRCNYAVPKDTWTEKIEKLDQNIDQMILSENQFLGKRKYEIIDEAKDYFVKPLIKSPLPHTYIKADDLPTSWDWRNVNGTNYMTWTVNQHIPVYCGSCWAQATSSSMADRLNIMRKAAFPQPAVAVQAIINCRWGGTCAEGGNSLEVYENAHNFGIPTMTCQNYVSLDPDNFACTDLQRCQNCMPTELGTDICFPVESYQDEYPKLFVDEYAPIDKNADDQIKAEIMARGPVSCSMYSTNNFHKYKSGIYKEKTTTTSTNHVIQLLGWGQSESGEKYWIGRNSWGTYWGMYGYFYISMDHTYNLNIATHCNFGVPKQE